jgi:hypothetical protein
MNLKETIEHLKKKASTETAEHFRNEPLLYAMYASNSTIAEQALEVINKQQEIIKIQSTALTKIKEWRKPDSGFWETSIPSAMEEIAENVLNKINKMEQENDK